MSPKRAKAFMDGRLTKDIRRTELDAKPPFRVFVWCINDMYDRRNYKKQAQIETDYRYGEWEGKVIGEYVCTKTASIKDETLETVLSDTQISADEYTAYRNKGAAKTFTITDICRYDNPKSIDKFKTKEKGYNRRNETVKEITV